jgi:hypothetical protein
VPKRTKASIPPAVAATAGAPLTSTPVYALTNLPQGRRGHHCHSHHSPGRDRKRPRIFARTDVRDSDDDRTRTRTAIVRLGRREVRLGTPAGDTDPTAGNHTRTDAGAPGADDPGEGVNSGRPGGRSTRAGLTIDRPGTVTAGVAEVTAGRPGPATTGARVTVDHLGGATPGAGDARRPPQA